MLKKIEDHNYKIVIIDQIENLSEMEDKIGFLCNVPHVSKTALYKLLLPTLINEEKLLFIDGDTIITGDIGELFDNNLDDCLVGAIRDYNGYRLKKNKTGYSPQTYFNSGVMLMNLKKIRDDDYQSQLIAFRLNKQNEYMDQDAFNYVFRNKVKILSTKYNFLTPTLYSYDREDMEDVYGINFNIPIDFFMENVLVFHYAGPWKPWKYYNVHGSLIWNHYAKQILPRRLLHRRSFFNNIPYPELELNYDFEMRFIKKKKNGEPPMDVSQFY